LFLIGVAFEKLFMKPQPQKGLAIALFTGTKKTGSKEAG
jgi:hypothetical protein